MSMSIPSGGLLDPYVVPQSRRVQRGHRVRTFLFRAAPPPEIYPLSLHDALPIYAQRKVLLDVLVQQTRTGYRVTYPLRVDRKSTRLNSSHLGISYAVFCLKKKTTSASPAPPPLRIGRPPDMR